MKVINILLSSAIGLALFSSCQNHSYRIEGSGDALIDGDTLYLTTDLQELTPTDSIVVKDGKFVLDRNDEIVQKTLVCINGELVHQGAREAMGL